MEGSGRSLKVSLVHRNPLHRSKISDKSPISGCTAGSRDNPQLFGNKRKTGIKIPRIPALSAAHVRNQLFPRRRTQVVVLMTRPRCLGISAEIPLLRDAGCSTETRELLDLRRYLLTAHSRPQMKTYRCPWCVSRTNHNILYFVHISCTSSLNTAICLWKLRISLARRGFARSNLHQIWGT